jgi:hypothetical protein
MMAFGFLSLAFLDYVKPAEPWRKIAIAVSSILLIGGLLLAKVARGWNSVIYRPEPKDPPSLLK